MDIPDRYPFLALPIGNKREQAFEKYFPLLEEYYNRYGHTNVPQTGPARDILERHCPGFVTWVSRMRGHYTDLKNGFKPEGKYTPNMHSKLKSIKFESRKPQKNMASFIKLMRGVRAFKELHGHCDLNKAGCRMPDGYHDLPQLLNEVRRKNLKLAKRKMAQFEELGINLDQRLPASRTSHGATTITNDNMQTFPFDRNREDDEEMHQEQQQQPLPVSDQREDQERGNLLQDEERPISLVHHPASFTMTTSTGRRVDDSSRR